MKRRKRNRLLALLLCLCTLIGMLPLSGTAYAADYSSQVTVNGIQYALSLNAVGDRYALVTTNRSYTGTKVTIPATITVEGKGSPWDGVWPVTKISGNAFKNCANLTSVSLESAVNLELIDDSAFYNCGKLISVTFAPNGKLRAIERSAFAGTGITSIQLPSTLEMIGTTIFERTGLTSIEIPASVTSIIGYAFSGCPKLTSVTFAPNSKLKSIDSYVFSGTGITSITIPASVTSILEYAFSGCPKLVSVTFAPNGKLKSIGGAAFVGTGITSIQLPSALETIGRSAFQSTGLTGIKIPASVTSIGDYAFHGCSKLSNVSFSSNSRLTTIGHSAFMNTGLRNVTLPANLSLLKERAFAYCPNLSIVRFTGNSAPTIESNAFMGSFQDNTFAFYPQAGEASYQAQPGLPANHGPYTDATAQIVSARYRHFNEGATDYDFALIDEESKTISVSVSDENKKDVFFFFSWYGKSFSPDETVQLDLTTPKKVSVTAHDGTKQEYTVQVGASSISGRVTRDGNAPGNVPLVLRASSGAVLTTTFTAMDGTYTFTNVPSGDYTIEADVVINSVRYTASHPVRVSGNMSNVNIALQPSSDTLTLTSLEANGVAYQESTNIVKLRIDGYSTTLMNVVNEIAMYKIPLSDLFIVTAESGETPVTVTLMRTNDTDYKTFTELIFLVSGVKKEGMLFNIRFLPPAGVNLSGAMFKYTNLHSGNYRHDIRLTGTGDGFPEAQEGYDAADMAQTITLDNHGTAPTGAVALSLADDADGAFELSTNSLASIEEGGQGQTFTVKPKSGLKKGTYTATLHAKGEYSAATSLKLSFTVGNAKPPLSFTDSDAYDIPASTVGTAIKEIDVSGGVSGGKTPYTFTATGLPAGISISEAGVISGTPTAEKAAGTAKITVTDADGDSKEITINYGEIAKPAPEQVATPAISPTGGTYNGTLDVVITCATEGASIYYTTDGSAPTTGSTLYLTPFLAAQSATIKAIAVKEGMADSEIVQVDYTIEPPPELSGEIKVATSGWKNFLNKLTLGLFFKNTQEVTIENNGVGSVIVEYFTSTEDLSEDAVREKIYGWQTYTAPFSLPPDAGVVVYARITDSAKTICLRSDRLTLDNKKPVFSLTDGENYDSAQTLTVSDDYALASVKQNGEEQLPADFTGKEKTLTLDTNGTYTITAEDRAENKASITVTIAISAAEQVQKPVFNPAGGTYDSPQSVEITCATKGAEIYYTTDGSTPTTGSTKYTGAIPVAATMTLKAIAVKSGMTDSAVAEAAYTIQLVPAHQHSWADTWVNDSGHHWHECTADGCPVTESSKKNGYGAHTASEWITTQQPTETEAGSKKKECTVCRYELETAEIPATGSAHSHTLSQTAAKEATCVDSGNIEYWYCGGCGKYFSDSEGTAEIGYSDTVIPATGIHTAAGEWQKDDASHWKHCSVCNQEIEKAAHSGGTANCHAKAVCEVCGADYGQLAPGSHDGDTEIRDKKEATETEDGYTGDTYCKGCNKVISTGTTIPATGHTHSYTGDWQSDGDGHWKLCDICSEPGEKTPHSGGTANCHAKAACQVCSADYGALDVDNHDGGTEIKNKKEATETEEGYTGDTYCKGCDQLLERGTSIPRLEPGHDHSYTGDWQSDGDGHWKLCDICSEPGEKTPHNGGTANCHAKAACQVCGAEYGALAPDNHDGGTEIKNKKEATEAEEGYTGDTYCKGCDKLLERGTSIPKLKPGHDHSWSDKWTNDSGNHWHECTADGCNITENSGKDGYAAHTPGEWINDKPLLENELSRKHQECTVCGHTIAVSATIKTEGVVEVKPDKDSLWTFYGAFKALIALKLNGVDMIIVPLSDTSANLTYPGYAGIAGIARAGSVEVTLYADFLKTLPAGTYTLEAEFEDGETTSVGSTEFTLAGDKKPEPTPDPDDQKPDESKPDESKPASGTKPTAKPENPSDVPPTGDNSPVGPLLALALLSGSMLLAIYGISRKKKRAGRHHRES